MSSLAPASKPGKPVCCAVCGHEFPQDPLFAVACPDCGTPPGQFCRRPSGHSGPFVPFHAARDLAALTAGFYNHTDALGQPCGKQATNPPTQHGEAESLPVTVSERRPMSTCKWCDAGYPVIWKDGPWHLTVGDWAMKWWEQCTAQNERSPMLPQTPFDPQTAPAEEDNLDFGDFGAEQPAPAEPVAEETADCTAECEAEDDEDDGKQPEPPAAETPAPAATPKVTVPADTGITAEPYKFDECTITVAITLLPSDGDPDGRRVLVSTRSHQDLPAAMAALRLAHLAADDAPLGRLPEIVNSQLETLRAELPNRAVIAAKAKKPARTTVTVSAAKPAAQPAAASAPAAQPDQKPAQQQAMFSF